ncbi:MAG: molybdate transport system permease protein [Kiritimatiellia bacterium]|jgi:molybdate transport system permease protein
MSTSRLSTRLASIPALALLVVLLLPLIGLTVSTSPAEILRALWLPSTHVALWLSAWTTTAALLIVVALGTPLAWWLSRSRGPLAQAAEVVVELPVVLPPAVLGIALLETFGRQGLLGSALESIGVGLPFTPAAVVLAQVLVAAPLYVLTASAAFRTVDDDLLLVARTLGVGPVRAWATIALPMAFAGLLSGAALAWARALGEFGATLMFAGNLPGTTQTLTLAIFQAMDHDLGQARAISLILVAVAVVLLLCLRLLGARRWP